jgi:hypothetical protein
MRSCSKKSILEDLGRGMIRPKLLGDDKVKLDKISTIRSSTIARLRLNMNDLIQASIGDAVSWFKYRGWRIKSLKSPNTLNRHFGGNLNSNPRTGKTGNG